MLAEEIAKEVKKKTKIHITPSEIEKIIISIPLSQNFWRIVRFSQKPVPVVSETIKILEERGLVKIEDGRIYLNMDVKPIEKSICNYCMGRGVKIDEKLFQEFKNFVKDRPSPQRKYDQGYITPESTVARVLFALGEGDILGKRILILGDDDLVSIGIALLRLAKEIVVLEIDKRLIDFIKSKGREIGVDIDARVFDLRKPIPKEFKGAFDTFFTDPPEALQAFKVFIEKGIWSLKDAGGAGYIGITLIDSSLSKWRKLQELILKSGAVITDIRRDFNEYEIWDYHAETLAMQIAPTKVQPDGLWYTSAMMRIEVVDKKKVRNSHLSLKSIYLDKESTTT